MNPSPAALSPVPPTPTADELVEANLPLVGHIVREVLGKVPVHVNGDDLTSAGMMALVVAARSFAPDRGVPFARYAAIRIRGALLDELRSMDWAARSVRTQARQMDTVQQELAAALGRTPTPDEVAATLGVSRAELDALQCDLTRARTLSLQGFAPETGPELLAENSAGPEALLLHREKLGYLHEAIEQLPERLRHVVVAYFFEQRQMSDIGAELGVTESRVSQLRAEALRMLKDGMNSQLEPALAPAPAAAPSPRPARSTGRRPASTRPMEFSGTLAGRLALTTPGGDVRPGAGVRQRIA
jgi:RNA polymerase sigma factor for flagellar operon FliA